MEYIWAIGPLLEEISSFDSTQNVTALVQSETNNNDGSMKGLENYPKAIALFDYSAEVDIKRVEKVRMVSHSIIDFRAHLWI